MKSKDFEFKNIDEVSWLLGGKGHYYRAIIEAERADAFRYKNDFRYKNEDF